MVGCQWGRSWEEGRRRATVRARHDPRFVRFEACDARDKLAVAARADCPFYPNRDRCNRSVRSAQIRYSCAPVKAHVPRAQRHFFSFETHGPPPRAQAAETWSGFRGTRLAHTRSSVGATVSPHPLPLLPSRFRSCARSRLVSLAQFFWPDHRSAAAVARAAFARSVASRFRAGSSSSRAAFSYRSATDLQNFASGSVGGTSCNRYPAS